jgi:predicted nucleic-acid-binding protein
MIAADTNLLVRLLVKDVPIQAEMVRDLIRDGESLYINSVVLSELFWVLTNVYGYPKNSFIAALDALLDSEGLHFFNAEIVNNALSDYVQTNVGFVDCLINATNSSNGFQTLTFDKKAAQLEGMELLG